MIFLLLLLSSIGYTQGQENIQDYLSNAASLESDSAQIDYLLTKAWKIARVDAHAGLKLLDNAAAAIESTQEKYKQDVLFYYQGVLNKNISNYLISDQYFQKYYDFHLRLGNKPHLAVVLMARANLYSDQARWAESMEVVTRSLQLAEEIKDTAAAIRASSKLGYLLMELGRLPDALNYHDRSLHLAKTIRDTSEIAIAYSNFGATFERWLKLDSARFYYLLARDLNIAVKDEWGLIYDYNNLGNIDFKIGNYLDAKDNAEIGLALAEKVGNASHIATSQILLGNSLIKIGSVRNGIRLIEEILDSSANYTLKDLSDAHEVLYNTYKDMGDIQSALYHIENFKRSSDSILNTDIAEQINNLEIQYETEKTARELNLVKSEQRITEVQLQSARNRNYLMAGSLLLISVLLFHLLRLNRKISAQKSTINKALEQKDILLREIHHRVKNNLQVISSLLSLQSRSETDPNVATALKQGQDRVQSMALIHQNLYEEESLLGVEVQAYFEKLIGNLFQSYNISPDRVKLAMDVADINLDVDTIIPVGLIINELISNALKYAFPQDRSGKITVQLFEAEGALQLVVADDGIGINTAAKTRFGKSFGYRLINVFKRQLDAKLDINGEKGTVVKMVIKDYRKVS